MSITINGATNTLTAASGLTIAGNTAVTGALSTTTNFSGPNTGYTLGAAADAYSTGVVVYGSGGGGNAHKVLVSCNTTVVGAFSSSGLAVTGTLSATTSVQGGPSGGGGLILQTYTGGTFGAVYSTTVTPDAANYSLISTGANTYLNGTASSNLTVNNVLVTAATATALTLGSGVKLLPTTDNTQDIGAAATGFKEIFADNGTINTSDARRKTEVTALSAAEINAAKQLAKEIGSFKFLAAVAEKGDAARNHIGMTVQRAIAIMEGNGLDPFAYSFICHDVWDDEFVEHPAIEAVSAKEAVIDEDGNVVTPAVEAVAAVDAWTEQTKVAGDKYSFRVHELLLFMAAGFEARLAALEAA